MNWDICVPPISVVVEYVVMLWSKQQRTFAVEAYYSNFRSVITVQRSFRRHIEIPPRSHASDRKCVLKWIDSCKATENVSKEDR
ncbi:hypothetical protein TNCV_3519411 [Trichonephila clavipes]|uniref:DUF4817 domain-containing protein n=1 Tax=Trichonephila clavipes TaxID=2585209 RepID=A0A8X6T0B3_TRICX|nr:hypothetical protein TNCV_3519411 [Trichonephila clavipes]